MLARSQRRGEGARTPRWEGSSCKELGALLRPPVARPGPPAGALLPPTTARGRRTWHVSAARCAGPRPSLAPPPPASSRAPDRISGTPAAVRGAPPDKGRKASLAATLPLRRRPRPRTSGPASPADPAPRRAPGGPRRRPDQGHRLLRVAEVGAPTPRGHEPTLRLLPLGPQAPRSCLSASLVPRGASLHSWLSARPGPSAERRRYVESQGPSHPLRLEVGEGRPPVRSQPCTCAVAGLLALPGSSEDRSGERRDYVSHKPARPCSKRSQERLHLVLPRWDER